jgi:hypothetical protein
VDPTQPAQGTPPRNAQRASGEAAVAAPLGSWRLCARVGDPIGLFELVPKLLVTFGPFDESLFVEFHQ